MIDTNSIMERLRNYCLRNPEILDKGYIKGLNAADGLIVVVYNGKTMNLSIDELESNKWLEPKEEIEELNDTFVMTPPISEEVEVMEDPIKEEPVVDSLDVQTPNQPEIKTLQDMQNAVLNKNEELMDRALETFAIDEKNGSININKAIKIVTDNSTNNVISCIRDNVALPANLSGYDITGKPMQPLAQNLSEADIQNLIDKSFDNILVYVGAARLKNIVYNEQQIASAKKKYASGIQDKLNVLGLNKPQNNVEEAPVVEDKKDEVILSKELKPDTNIKRAGFADILILTIIVIIYAAIIINLVSKLN